MLSAARQAILGGQHGAAGLTQLASLSGLGNTIQRGMASAPKKQTSKSSKNAGTASPAPDGGDSSAANAAAIQEKDAVKILLQAIENVRPQLAVKTKRVATRVMYVPGVMPEAKSRSLAVHWIVDAATARKAKSKASMAQCLAMELLLAYQKQGSVRQKRDDMHKLALANRTNLHQRWW